MKELLVIADKDGGAFALGQDGHEILLSMVNGHIVELSQFNRIALIKILLDVTPRFNMEVEASRRLTQQMYDTYGKSNVTFTAEQVRALLEKKS